MEDNATEITMIKRAITEIIQFLQPNSRKDQKAGACTLITQLTGSPSGLIVLHSNSEVLKAIINLVNDSETTIAKTVLEALVNISADEEGTKALLELRINIVDVMIKCISNSEYEHADLCCGVLANLSFPATFSEEVLRRINETSMSFYGLLEIFCDINFNKKNCELHLLANVLSNISQTETGRKMLMNKDENHIDKLLPFVEYKQSSVRRKSIIQMVHNCCFQKEFHQWLIDEKNILSWLLLPLAGPDVFTVEENNLMPSFLQFLPDDKTREVDIQIRWLLLEAINKLCMTMPCREKLREQNVYLIMKEYHLWEKNVKLITLVEDIVNFLIRKETEILCDDVSTVVVPDDMVKKFVEWDENLQQEENNSESTE